MRVLNGRPSSPSTVPKLMCCNSTFSIAPQPRRGEQLLEVQALPMIDDVQNRVGLPVLDAILDRGQIGRGVQKRAVLLANDQRRVVAGEKDADRAVALAGDAAVCKVLDHAGQPIVIKALAQRVVERDAQPLINAVDVGQAGGQELAPQSQVLRLAAVQVRPSRPAPLARCRGCAAISFASCESFWISAMPASSDLSLPRSSASPASALAQRFGGVLVGRFFTAWLRAGAGHFRGLLLDRAARSRGSFGDRFVIATSRLTSR